jgi:hypothetical protein
MTDRAGERLDSTDEGILDRLAALFTRLDPPPFDLDERVRFAIALEDADVEVARLSEERLIGTGARGAERTRTITFDCESRTIMVTVADTPAGRVRIDGWLAPAAQLRVELRVGEWSASTMSDDGGRFIFDEVDHGLGQLLVHPVAGAESSTVVTPSVLL